MKLKSLKSTANLRDYEHTAKNLRTGRVLPNGVAQKDENAGTGEALEFIKKLIVAGDRHEVGNSDVVRIGVP